MIKVTGYVMVYAPYGIFALIAVTVGVHGLSITAPDQIDRVMYLIAFLHILIVYTPFITLVGKIIGAFSGEWVNPAGSLPPVQRRRPSLKYTGSGKAGSTKSISSFTIP